MAIAFTLILAAWTLMFWIRIKGGATEDFNEKVLAGYAGLSAAFWISFALLSTSSKKNNNKVI